MRILVVDVENQGLDFVLRCAEAGHDVRWFKHGKPNRDGEGFRGFEIVTDWRESMKWARDGLIMTTGNCHYLREFDRWRDLGYKIFAPTQRSAALEIKRSFGLEELQRIGIECPPYETFKSLEDASRFARKSDQCWVFKTLGDEDDKSLSFVSSSPAEMVGWIDRQIKRGMKLKGPCMLQEKIDMLCEFGVSGWFGPEGFLPGKWQECWEHKKLMNEEIGPNTGEMGTVCQYVEESKLATDMLLPMENYLLKAGHRGDFSVGVGIDKKGRAWPFEFTVRCGWPAFFIQVASHKGDPAQWMRDLLDGEDTLKVSYDVAIGAVMAQPKFPYNLSKPEDVEGNPISGLEEVDDHAHLIGVMMGRGPKMDDGAIIDAAIPQTTGEYVLCMTGLGKTISTARKVLYKAVDDVKFPNAMYRTDIGNKLEPVLEDMHKYGYALKTEWE